MRHHRTRLAATLLVVPLFFGALAGCGDSKKGADEVASVASGGAAPSPSGGEAPAEDNQERWLQFTKCLREQGLEVTDPGPGGGLPRIGKTADQAKRKAAIAACRQYAPGVFSGGSLSPENKQAMLDYVKCLRDRGVNIGDPDPKTGLPPRGDLSKFRNPDAKMKEAQKACVDKLPEGLGGGSR